MDSDSFPVYFDVFSIDENLKERIKRYFLIQRKSGGGECGNVDHVRDHTYKIAFKDREAQQRVLHKDDHELPTPSGTVSLRVRENLLLLPTSNATVEQNETPPKKVTPQREASSACSDQHLEKKIVWKLDPYLLRYLKENHQAQQDIQMRMDSLDSSFELHLDDGEIMVKGSAQTAQWESRVDKTVEYLQEKYCCHFEANQAKIQFLLKNAHMFIEGQKVYCEVDQGFAVLVGETSKVQESLKVLEALQNWRSSGDQGQVKTVCRLGEGHLTLLWKELERDLWKRVPGVRVSRKEGGNLEIEGSTSDVQLASDWVRGRTAELPEMVVTSFSTRMIAFLKAQGPDGMAKVLQGVLAQAEISASGIRLVALTEETLREAYDAVGSQLKEEDISLSDSPSLMELLKKEKQRLNQGKIHVDIHYKPGSVHLLGFRKPVDKMKEVIQKFLQDNAVVQSSVSLPLLKVYHNINQLLDLLKIDHTGVELLASPSTPSVVLKGPQHMVAALRGKLDATLKTLLQDTVTINQPGTFSFFQGVGREYLEVVGRNNRCLIQLQDSASSVSDRFHLEGGLCVSVRQGDITQERADALVNSANENLEHAGGVAEALSTAGGPEVQKASTELVRQIGSVATGKAVATAPGLLPCKILVHAVGPKWSRTEDSKKIHSQLESAVMSALEIAEAQECCTLAMPCLSSGIYGVPLDICATAIVRAVIRFGKQRRMLQKITLIDKKPGVVKAMQVACTNLLGKSPLPLESSLGPLSTSPAEENTSRTTVSKIKVQIIKGNIEDQQVDAIVSPMRHHDPESSRVGHRLMELTGGAIKVKFHQASQGHRTTTQDVVLVEGDVQLKSNCVIFLNCERWDGSQHPVNILQQGVKKVLDLCETWAFSSLAFPVIGPGVTLAFPHKVAATILMEEIEVYKQNRTSATELSILIVIHPTDNESAAAFQVVKDGPPLNDVQKTLPSQASFYRGLSLSQDHVTVLMGGMKLELVFGDILKETTAVIVNSTNFSSNQSGVSQAILTAAGHGVQTEFHQGRSQADGFFKTSGGTLNCQAIIHISAEKSTEKIKKLCAKVLKCCEQHGYGSVAFPAVCAGGAGLNPKTVSVAMLDGMASAVRDSPFIKLSLIRIVILLRPVFDEFRYELESRLGTSGPTPTIIEQGMQFFKKDKKKRNIQRQHVQTNQLLSTHAGGHKLSPCCPKPAVLCVTALSREAINKAHKELESIMQKQIYEKNMGTPELKQMSQSQHDSLLKLAQTLEISVQETAACQYVVRGIKEKVLEFCGAVLRMRNEVLSKELVACRVQWLVCGSDGIWSEFGLEANCRLEEKKQDGSTSVMIEGPGGEYFKVDLRKMKATDKKSMTWTLKRLDLSTDLPLPVEWEEMKEGESLKKAELQPNSAEYQKVAADFSKTANNVILKIERVQNVYLWQAYVGKKEQFTCKNGLQKVGERFLFHGTSQSACLSIETGGFNRSFAGQHGTALGKGVYFAVDANYSTSTTYSPPDGAGHRYMYMAQVLTGHYTKGKADMKVPPERGNTKHVERFDSLVDNVQNPSMYVIFHDDQAYPQYLITFT